MKYEPHKVGELWTWWDEAAEVVPDPAAKLPRLLFLALNPNQPGGRRYREYTSRLNAFDGLEAAANTLTELADAARRSVELENPTHE